MLFICVAIYNDWRKLEPAWLFSGKLVAFLYHDDLYELVPY
jgi:hypothetical protein